MAIDFCVWLGKDIGETCALLREGYSEECFQNERSNIVINPSTMDARRLGLPHASPPHSLIREVDTVAVVLNEDCHLSVRQLVEVLHIPKMTVHRILKDKLEM